ncbi:MAG: coenzyme F420-0:L-glutamate ligase [Solirubrobacterales bacterium]
MSGSLGAVAVPGLPEIVAGDDLGALIAGHADPPPTGADIVVVCHKAVAKAEGRLVDLDDVTPGAPARELAARLDRDPALVELVLAESGRIVRAEPSVLITETRQGWVCANAGIDRSNVPGDRTVALLPVDADASARRIRDELEGAAGVRPAVVVSDSFGRPWRLGQAEVAIGCAGIEPLDDWRGRVDAGGQPLEATRAAVADLAAGIGGLLQVKDAGTPISVISGLGRHVIATDGPGAGALRRPSGEDLFR